MVVVMPASPFYGRLTNVAHLDYSDPDSGMLSELREQIGVLKQACSSFSGNTGVSGNTNNAMAAWVSEFEGKLTKLQDRLECVGEVHSGTRGMMEAAKRVHGTLSPELLHPADYSAAARMFRGSKHARRLEEEYLSNLAIQRNAQREAVASATLVSMNTGVSTASVGFSMDSLSDLKKLGLTALTAAIGGSLGATIGKKLTKLKHAPIGGLSLLPSVSPSSSILAGVDVTTMPIGGYMTADGPVGGHIPAPVTDANDPRWHPDYRPSFDVSSQSKGLAIAGGALTTGGALAGLGRMTTSMSSIASSMGTLASRAASAQFGTVPAGGSFAPSTASRLASSNAISRVMNNFENGALTPRGTAQAGNWGSAARMANTASPSATGANAARAGSGFPRGMGAPAAGGAASGKAAGSTSAGRGSAMSARARAAASIRPAGAPAAGAAKATTGAKGAASPKTAASSTLKSATAASAKGTAGSTKATSSPSTTSAKGAASAGAAGSTARAAASSAVGRGPVGTVAGAASKEDKERAKRRALAGLKAVRVDGVEEQIPMAAGLSAGSADAMKPVAVRDQGDQW